MTFKHYGVSCWERIATTAVFAGFPGRRPEACPAVISLGELESRVHLHLAKVFRTARTSLAERSSLLEVIRLNAALFKRVLSLLSLKLQLVSQFKKKVRSVVVGEVGECDSLVYPVRGRLSSGSSLPGRGPVEQ